MKLLFRAFFAAFLIASPACAGGVFLPSVPSSAQNTAAPSTPSSGITSIWADSTDKTLKAKNDSGVVSNTVQPITCPNHQWADVIAGNGAVTCVQPAFTDISGILAAAQLPLPTTSALGGIEAISCASHQWIDVVPTTAIQPTCAQPGFSDLSGSIAASQLIAPTTSAFGGIFAQTCPTHQWIDIVPASAAQPSCAQPTFADISGTLGLAQGGTNATNGSGAASNLSHVYVACVTATPVSTMATSETAIYSCAVPPLPANSCIRVNSFWGVTNDSNTKTLKWHWSAASGSLTGSAWFSETLTTSGSYNSPTRVVCNPTTATQTGSGGGGESGASSSAPGVGGLTVTSTTYVVFSASSTSGSDTETLQDAIVEVMFTGGN